MKTIESLIKQIKNSHDELRFEHVMAVIETHYDFSPSAFRNGDVENSAEQNQGSCKLFAFALLHELSQEQTLNLFAQHYQSVLADPKGEAHQNIRQFMAHGWNGIEFVRFPLTAKG